MKGWSCVWCLFSFFVPPPSSPSQPFPDQTFNILPDGGVSKDTALATALYVAN